MTATVMTATSVGVDARLATSRSTPTASCPPSPLSLCLTPPCARAANASWPPSASDPKERQRVIREHIDQIKIDSHNRTHTVEIHLRFPFVGDKLVYRDPSDKRKGYDIVPGGRHWTRKTDRQSKAVCWAPLAWSVSRCGLMTFPCVEPPTGWSWAISPESLADVLT